MTGSAARILVVDDEKLIRWSVGENLTRRGFEVETAETGERALELVTSLRPQVALLDVRLPGMDGVAVLRRALALDPDLVVVMMSAHGTIDLAVDAMKVGAADFLVKPFPLTSLDDAIDRAIATAISRQHRVGEDQADHTASLVGASPGMARVREIINRLAASDATTVLIEGESGSGKEVVARCVHAGSSRAGRPFTQINCAALPEQLLESELFGHERGAFTDARAQKRGLIEVAEGGSLMLDEIGDLAAGSQAKLLRLLEERTFRRVGGVAEQRADVRVIAATNVDLRARMEEKRFRSDLFFRLNVVRIPVPPLRDRREDVPLLCSFFIGRYNEQLKRQVRGVSADALELLTRYHWPGNVRELRNTVERAFILYPNADELRVEHLPPELREGSHPAPHSSEGSLSLDETERRLIVEAMDKCRGNQSQAARLLAVSRDTLRYRLKKYGML